MPLAFACAFSKNKYSYRPINWK